MICGQMPQALLDVVQLPSLREMVPVTMAQALPKNRGGIAGCKYYGERTTAHHISLCSLGTNVVLLLDDGPL